MRSTFCVKMNCICIAILDFIDDWMKWVWPWSVFTVRTKGQQNQCCVHKLSLCSGKALIMPIRRAAATPTQEKAPSAAAEKGEARVVHDPRNIRPVNAPLTQIHWGQGFQLCTVLTSIHTEWAGLCGRIDLSQCFLVFIAKTINQLNSTPFCLVYKFHCIQSSLADMSKSKTHSLLNKIKLAHY